MGDPSGGLFIRRFPRNTKVKRIGRALRCRRSSRSYPVATRLKLWLLGLFPVRQNIGGTIAVTRSPTNVTVPFTAPSL